MTVGELITELQKVEPERLVVMAKDAEGNGYSPLRSFWIGAYLADTTYSGDVGYLKLTDELREQGYGEEDVIDGVPAVILSPVN